MASPRLTTTRDRLLLLTIGAVILALSRAAHFRGGTISWRPVGNNEVEFFFKLGWTYNRGPGCTESKIGLFLEYSGLSGRGGGFPGGRMGGRNKTEYWECIQGCGIRRQTMETVGYVCTGANREDDWEQGQRHFNFTFPDEGPFVVEYNGGNWMELGGGKGKGRWGVRTTVDLRNRSDIGRPNSSPVSLSQPIYYKQHECYHVLKIPVVDPDGDNVRCRWAKGDECVSVCEALPFATLDESTCTITFNATSTNTYVANDYYAVALTIEDYPRTSITLDGTETKKPTDVLSSIPLQFLIQTKSYPTPCEEKPRFVPPTPAEFSVLLVQAGDTLTVQLVADNWNDTSAKVNAINVIGPLQLQQSSVMPYQGVPNTYFKNLTWDTSAQDVGEHIVCAYASNTKSKNSDTHCFTIKIVSTMPNSTTPASTLTSTVPSSTVKTTTVPTTTVKTTNFPTTTAPTTTVPTSTAPKTTAPTTTTSTKTVSTTTVPTTTVKTKSVATKTASTTTFSTSTASTTTVPKSTSPTSTESTTTVAKSTASTSTVPTSFVSTTSPVSISTSSTRSRSWQICMTTQRNGVAVYTNYTDSCEPTEYCDCKCVIFPHSSPEEDNTLHTLLAVFLGLPVGLVLSLLTACCCNPLCCSRPCNEQAYRETHPPTSRTQVWINTPIAPVETAVPESPEYSRKFASAGMTSLQVPVPSLGGPVLTRQSTTASTTTMNIYRASFNDNALHKTGPKKYPDTYQSGARDWNI